MLDYVHSHSLDILAADDDDGVPQFVIPPGADLEKLRGGPDVTFDGLMPKPGRYRAWTQFRRNDTRPYVHLDVLGGGAVRKLTVADGRAVSRAPCWIGWPPRRRARTGSITTTVLFDREIVRILNNHCVMCHSDGSRSSFPLSTYEQTWLRGRDIRTEILRRHMPPWPAVAGYGEFANDNSLTVRETQFMVSWVEGLGPRNAGTVFLNVARPEAASAGGARVGARRPLAAGRTGPVAPADANARGTRQADFVQRTVVDPGLTSERQMRALEYQPGDRRVVRAATFFVEGTGQWLGSWTPWYGFVKLPDGVSARLPARSRIVADVHYRSTDRAGRRSRHSRSVLHSRSHPPSRRMWCSRQRPSRQTSSARRPDCRATHGCGPSDPTSCRASHRLKCRPARLMAERRFCCWPGIPASSGRRPTS